MERIDDYFNGNGNVRCTVGTFPEKHPSDYCLATNAHALARYAALCVEQGVVPIVEPGDEPKKPPRFRGRSLKKIPKR